MDYLPCYGRASSLGVQMKSKIHVTALFVFIISMVVSASRAEAMSRYEVLDVEGDLYATPYPTLTPIGLIPTSISLEDVGQPLDFSCPAGVPEGYGTVTPSTDWLYACAQCLPTYTPQSFYTSTPGPTRTPFGGGGTPLPPICVTAQGGGEQCYTATAPTPTVTVTNTPTVTPTVSGTPTQAGLPACGSVTPTSLPSATATTEYWTKQNDSAAVYSGTWSTANDSNSYGGTHRYTTSVGAYATYTFNGTGVRFYMVTNFNHGFMDVYLDDIFVQRVSQYSANVAYNVVGYSVTGLSYAVHVLKLVHVGQGNGSSSPYYSTIDAFEYLTPAMTPTPLSGVLVCVPNQSGTCTSDGSHGVITFSGSASAMVGQFYIYSGGSPVQITTSVSFSHSETYQFPPNQVNDKFEISQAVYGILENTGFGWCLGTSGSSSSCSASHSGFYTTVPSAGNPTLTIRSVDTAKPVTSQTVIYRIEVWVGIQCSNVTATPTGIPGSSNYCSSVSSSSVPNQFAFTGGNIVYQQCETTPEINFQTLIDALLPGWLSGFVSYFQDIFPTTVIVYPITICIRSRDYSLYIFGIRMPIEGFIGFLIFVSAVRMFNPAMSSLGGLLGNTRDTSSADYVRSGNRNSNGGGSEK